MVFWYKNSFLASLVSIVGCLMVMGGIATFGDEAVTAVILILIGIALAIWGKVISANKAFRKWWRQVEDKNLEDVISKDLNTAITVYQKNPQRRTIKKIATLNASYAEYIQQNIANKK